MSHDGRSRGVSPADSGTGDIYAGLNDFEREMLDAAIERASAASQSSRGRRGKKKNSNGHGSEQSGREKWPLDDNKNSWGDSDTAYSLEYGSAGEGGSTLSDEEATGPLARRSRYHGMSLSEARALRALEQGPQRELRIHMGPGFDAAAAPRIGLDANRIPAPAHTHSGDSGGRNDQLGGKDTQFGLSSVLKWGFMGKALPFGQGSTRESVPPRSDPNAATTWQGKLLLDASPTTEAHDARAQGTEPRGDARKRVAPLLMRAWLGLVGVVATTAVAFTLSVLIAVGQRVIERPQDLPALWAGLTTVSTSYFTVKNLGNAVHGGFCWGLGPTFVSGCDGYGGRKQGRGGEGNSQWGYGLEYITITATPSTTPPVLARRLEPIMSILKHHATASPAPSKLATPSPPPGPAGTAASSEGKPHGPGPTPIVPHREAKELGRLNHEYARHVNKMRQVEVVDAVTLRNTIAARPATASLHVWEAGVGMFAAGPATILHYLWHVCWHGEPAPTLRRRTNALLAILRESRRTREKLEKAVIEPGARIFGEITKEACQWRNATEKQLADFEIGPTTNITNVMASYDAEMLAYAALDDSAAAACRMAILSDSDIQNVNATVEQQLEWLGKQRHSLELQVSTLGRRREPFSSDEEVRLYELALISAVDSVLDFLGYGY